MRIHRRQNGAGKKKDQFKWQLRMLLSKTPCILRLLLLLLSRERKHAQTHARGHNEKLIKILNRSEEKARA